MHVKSPTKQSSIFCRTTTRQRRYRFPERATTCVVALVTLHDWKASPSIFYDPLNVAVVIAHPYPYPSFPCIRGATSQISNSSTPGVRLRCESPIRPEDASSPLCIYHKHKTVSPLPPFLTHSYRLSFPLSFSSSLSLSFLSSSLFILISTYIRNMLQPSHSTILSHKLH